MALTTLAINIASALILGALIGGERQWRQRLAGLRTNTLVCVGSALFVSVSMMTVDEISPTRIAAQVVSGIGFLGAGVIFKEGLNVRGLNTAATLWCSAAIGVLAGSGLLQAAIIGTVAILVANMLLRPLAQHLNRQSETDVETEVNYRLRITCREPDESHIRKLVLQNATSLQMLLRGLFSRDVEQPGRVEVWADLVTTGRRDTEMERMLTRMGLEAGVTAISWQIAPSHGEELSSS